MKADAPLRVLAVDDHPTNRMVLETILDLVTADVTSAEDGAQAVAAFQAATFDIILMDLQMPVMDGLAATAAIRRLEREGGFPRTPVLVVTANTLSQHIQQAMAAGADHHLAKPVTPDGLLQAMDFAATSAAARDAAATKATASG